MNFISPSILSSLYPLLIMNSTTTITHTSITPHLNDIPQTIHFLHKNLFSYTFHLSTWLPTQPNTPNCHPHLLLCPTQTHTSTNHTFFLTTVDPLLNPISHLTPFHLPTMLANATSCHNDHTPPFTCSKSLLYIPTQAITFTPIKYTNIQQLQA